ncbi:MAG TPA: hypothetical protein VFO76_08825, partial [Candidatus Kapabacteria bacterium]|nr:hypothetical protein [Candidatus Kapabacteria bacterium]
MSDAVCLASNGYGNWLAEANKNTFYLWGDTTRDESASATPPIPSGKIFSGNLSAEINKIPTEVKVTTNLVGNTIYVWPTTTDNATTNRTTFEVRILGDNRNGSAIAQQIDINYTGIPNTSGSRDAIKSTITTVSPSIPTFTGITPISPVIQATNVSGGSIEADWHDTYDVCCDGVHLYIVWETYVGSLSANFVFVTAVNISDGSVVSGFPKQVGTTGVRPTITCDVRNQTSSNLTYLISLITSSDAIQLWWDNVLLGTPLTLTKLFDAPVTNTPTNYQFIKHVKPVFGSVNGTSVGVQGVYAIVNGASNLSAATGDDIIFHKVTGNFSSGFTSTGNAFYVDGMQIGNHTHVDASTTTTHFCPVINQYIQAFANPYDGRATSNYDEFHCLYQLDLGSPFSGPPASTWNTSSQFPLLIAGGHGTGMQTKIVSEDMTGTTFNSFLSSPTAASLPNHYLASVNQMGIHVFWEGEGTPSNRWFYSRDQRSFDEDIEENTLLTYYNEVRDGSSHGGTVGATLQPSRILTMWTDPNLNNGSGTFPTYSPSVLQAHNN